MVLAPSFRCKHSVFITLLIAAAFPSVGNASCGASFCTANSNWTTESAATEPGTTFDIRYEYIKQDQPRSGSRRVAVGEIQSHHDEVKTVNQNMVATFTHNFGSSWGVSVVAPVLDREHTHIHNHHGEKINQEWNFTRLGDLKVLGRYQFKEAEDPLKPATAGITFGAKLPTGKSDVKNKAGEKAERTLQPGTGTTDAIIGAYYQQKLPQWSSSWFAQAQFQHALDSDHGYRPGNQFGADIGYRYGVTDKLGALIQLNYLRKGRDSGAEAEREDSGSRSIYLTPGVSYAVTDKVQIYGFIQKPLHQHVNGVQLTADKALVIGLTGRF